VGLSKDQHAVYEFGPFRLDASERLLLREGQPVQAVGVMAYPAKHE